jgi:hypothetical protein
VRGAHAIAALAVLALAASLTSAAQAPVAFKTVAALTEAPLPELDTREALDIASIVRAIPDRGTEGTANTVYAANPVERYQRSVVEGLGNCSNLVKGLAWRLLREGRQFEIVYLLPIDGLLEGQGHTVLRANLALPEGPRVGLADIAAAAIPRDGGRVLDVGDITAARAVYLDPLRPESEDWSPFYAAEFLADSVVGRTSSAETARWFRFLEAIHLDLGVPEKLDKILYSGIGVALGMIPPIHVPDVESLRSRHPLTFVEMSAAIWGVRISSLILLVWGPLVLVDALRALRRRSGTVECRDLADAGS